MISSAQVAIFLALCSIAKGFSPSFTTPRQCSSVTISWSSVPLPMSPVALSEITLSLIPLEDHAHFAPEPYTLAIPCSGEFMESGQVEIQRLPFPAGTQFFASAYVPGASGPVRRTVSKVFTVEHSSDSSCLNAAAPVLDKRAKAFGMKRQVNVIGVGAIPASDSGTPAGTTLVVAPPPAASSTGAVPPINVIGTGQIPASSGVVDTPGNVAPAPSASGPVPPVQVIGTSFVTATSPPEVSATASATSTNFAFVPNFTTIQVGQDNVTTGYANTATEAQLATETTTSCTETPTETPLIESMQDMSTMTTTVTVDNTDLSEEQPCTDLPEDTSSSADVASPTSTSPVVHYSSFDDMVNAANSMFHAWNPYGPAYTQST